MTIIKIESINGLHPIESQSHRRTCWQDSYIEVPPHLIAAVWATGGHCDLTIEGGVLTGITPLPIPEPEVDVEALRAAKLAELSAAGNAAIVAGVEVTLPSTGEEEHFALHETDQINLTTALTAVEQGAAGYPYHADGQLCRLYPAQDILAISQAAIAHKLYHTTYCNHLLVWARRAETAEELGGITYGAELPEDLADNLAAVLAAAGGAV